jgi:hypothetical protein
MPEERDERSLRAKGWTAAEIRGRDGVGFTPKTISRRSTYRRTVLKAFYLPTGYLSGAALATDGPDDAFDIGILPGRAWRGSDGCHADCFGGAAERRIEGRLAIMEHESRRGVVCEGLAKLLTGHYADIGPAGNDPPGKVRSWQFGQQPPGSTPVE